MHTQQQLLDHIQEGKQYCMDQIDTDCQQQYKAITAEYYNELFKAFSDAVKNYFTTTNTKESNLYDMIMRTYTSLVMTKLAEANQDIFRTDTSLDFDFRKVFTCDNTFDELMNVEPAQFYSGCKTNPAITLNTHASLLSRMQVGEEKDIVNRQPYINYSSAIQNYNQLVMLFEELTVKDFNMSRKDMAKVIYIDYGALDIIQTYGLRTYIPKIYK